MEIDMGFERVKLVLEMYYNILRGKLKLGRLWKI